MDGEAMTLWCPTCGRSAGAFRPGPGGGRPNASCPHCLSLERHRFLSILLGGLGPWLAGASLVVDVAPSGPVAQHLRRLCPEAYVGLDFDPDADGRDVDVRASVEALPLADDSVDLLTCYHVLEHVPDDRAAMSELARVLKPGGMAVVQVPWRPQAETDEDVHASVQERITRFGQADHVRYYGHDFEDRLAEAGLDLVRLTSIEVVGAAGCSLMALMPNECLWLVRPATGRPRAAGLERVTDAVTTHLSTALAEALARERHAAPLHDAIRLLGAEQAKLGEELDRLRDAVSRSARDTVEARREAARWETAYRRLRGRGAVRAMAAISRAVPRGLGR